MNKDNKNSSNIKYTGTVTVKYVKNNKVKSVKRKNEGTINLFTFITHCIGGNYLATLRPTYIQGFYLEDDTEKEAFVNNNYITGNPIYFNEESQNNTISDSVQLTFLIPYNSFITSEPITILKLYNGKKEICAVVTLDEGIEADSDSNVIIYWKLSFSSNEEGE